MSHTLYGTFSSPSDCDYHLLSLHLLVHICIMYKWIFGIHICL